MSALSLAVNARNDLFRAADGNIATTADLYAVTQACAHAAKTLLGEMMYATDNGVPYFDVVWTGTPNLAQFEAYLRRAFLAVDGVVRVQSLSVTIGANVAAYKAVIQTTYGTGVVNG